MAAPVRPRTSQDVFTRVARRYDLVNGLMSVGWVHHWRSMALAPFAPGDRLVEVGAGTGSNLARRRSAPGLTVGVDLNAAMLAVAAEQARGTPLVRAELEQLPLRSACADGVLVCFALFDMSGRDLVRPLTALRRLLVPGGRCSVVELSAPAVPGLARALGPLAWAAGRVARTRADHVIEEATTAPPVTLVTNALVSAGFTDVRTRRLAPGVAVRWTGIAA